MGSACNDCVTSDAAKRALTVLVLDDEPEVVRTMAAVLEDDFTTLTATTVAEAFSALEAQAIDVVCSDYRMPEMNGLEFFRSALDRWPNLACVLVTGMRDVGAMLRSSKLSGAFPVVVKPYDPSHLIKIVNQAADSARYRRAEHHDGAELEAINDRIDALRSG